MENLWPPRSNLFSHDESNTVGIVRQGLVCKAKGEALTLERLFCVKSTLLAIADVVAKVLTPQGIVTGIYPNNFVVMHGQAVTTIEADRRDMVDSNGFDMEDHAVSMDSRELIGDFRVTVTGSRDVAARIFEAVQKAYSAEKFAKLRWWYKGPHGVANQVVYLPEIKTVLRSEFYPDMDEPESFIESYLASEASVLLIAGAPGTGKTTFLRHMIAKHRLSAHILYDEDLMKSDAIFQDFLFGNGDIMVIEDADTILAPRESDNNKLMARFLNVSDGLIKLPNKKLIFTTNLSDFAKVDPALTRPGRCFGVLHTRPLNLQEAQAAARVAGLPVPLQKQEYTLAELFNHDASAPTVRRIGFAS